GRRPDRTAPGPRHYHTGHRPCHPAGILGPRQTGRYSRRAWARRRRDRPKDDGDFGEGCRYIGNRGGTGGRGIFFAGGALTIVMKWLNRRNQKRARQQPGADNELARSDRVPSVEGLTSTGPAEQAAPTLIHA